MEKYKRFWRDLERITTYMDEDGQEHMRLIVYANFKSLSEGAEQLLKSINCSVTRYSDGSAVVDAACLVPWEFQTNDMNQIADRFADAINSLFDGVTMDKIEDCAWDAGGADDRWDDLLTQEERSLIHGTKSNKEQWPTELRIKDYLGNPVTLKPRVELYSVIDFMGRSMPGLAMRFDTFDEELGIMVPYATLTKCLGEFIGIKNSAYIDTNNCSFTDQLLEQGIADPTEFSKSSGLCTYPLWVFREGFLQQTGGENYRKYAQAYDQYMGISGPDEAHTLSDESMSEHNVPEKSSKQGQMGGVR